MSSVSRQRNDEIILEKYLHFHIMLTMTPRRPTPSCLFFLYGCVQSSYNYNQSVYIPPDYSVTVSPNEVTETVQFGSITLSPGKTIPSGLIQSFVLKVQNTSKTDIHITWDDVIFIENGKTNGGFMFDGIVYSKRNEHKPDDIVFSGSTFEKTIWPNNKVFFGSGISSWLHEHLDGDVGVYITIGEEGHRVSKKLILNFINTRMQ